MPECFNYYHVVPSRTANTARYPRNFVRYSPLLAPLTWFNGISKALQGKPMPRLGNSLIKVFDRPGQLHPRWGSPDEIGILRCALELFSRGIDGNAHVSAIGRFLLRTFMTGHLKNRVETITYYETHRKFIERHGRYQAPVLVTGFPRTGSTLLQRLLSEDPNTRAPYTYELEKATPPLRAGTDPMQDTRIQTSAATMATLKKLAPGFVEKFAQSHFWSATEREESLIYMQIHNGINFLNAAQAGREYLQMINQLNMADALMKYERNFFTMLDAYAPARSHWTNKAPNYAPYFAKIFDYYPDARVIVTHRHPGKNVASVCRLVESWALPFDVDGSFDKIRFGEVLLNGLKSFFNAPLAYRTAHPERESQIVDCMYRDLFDHPIDVVRAIYTKFGLDYTQIFENRMREYLANNQQGKYGRHQYTNPEYGFDPDQLYASLHDYYNHYGYHPSPSQHD